MNCTRSIKSNWAIITGMLLLVVGIIFSYAKAWLLDKTAPSFVLEPNSSFQEFWRKPPVTIPTTIYAFNWTNADQLYNSSVKPTFEELGPYRFQQSMEKINVIWNDNDTVSYSQIRTFYYDQKQPNGNLRDNFTTINLSAMAAAYKAENWDYWTSTMISGTLSMLFSDVYVDRTVEDILFTGYSDSANELYKYFSFLTPEIPKFELYGLLGYKNKSSFDDGIINMNTGVSGNYNIRNWNYLNETPSYEKPCTKLSGSVGEIFSPRWSKENLEVFFTEACRPISLEYKEEAVTDGILGYKYIVGKETLDNGTLYPENKCYSNSKSLRRGMFNLTSCKYGFPVFMSTAHFYEADPAYLGSVEGLRPEKRKHESYIIVEPITGVLLKGVMRIQINAHLRPVPSVELFKEVPNIFLPILWAELDFTLPDYLLRMLKIFLKAPSIYSIIANLVIIAGIMALCSGLLSRLWIVWRNNTFLKETNATGSKPEDVPLRSG